MGKKRVFELAKEMALSNQDLIERLRKNGFEVKSHSSTVDEDDVKRAFEKEAERKRASTDEKRVSGTVIRRRSKGGGSTRRRKNESASSSAEAKTTRATETTPGARKGAEATQPTTRKKAEPRRVVPEAAKTAPAVAETKAPPPKQSSADVPPKTEVKTEKRSARPVRVPRRIESPAQPTAVAKAAAVADGASKSPVMAAKPDLEPSAPSLSVEEPPKAEAKAPLEASAPQAVSPKKALKNEPEAQVSPTERLAPQKPVVESSPPEAVAKVEPPKEEVEDIAPVPEEQESKTVEADVSRPKDEIAAEPPASAETEEKESPASAPVVASSEEEPEKAAAKTEANEERSDRDVSDEVSSRREARAARPDRRSREDIYDDDDDKPDLDLADFGLSEADFAMRPQEDTGTRVAPPPPSTTVPNPKKDDVSKPRVVGKIDPEKLKARLNASKRPEPPKEWGRQKPEQAPGVTEKVMVKDAGGRGKLVDVREATKNKKSGRPKREEMSAKELLEAKTKQVFYPTPSRKKPKGKKKHHAPREAAQPLTKQPVVIGDTITVAELSQQMSRKANELILWLMRNGVMANINQPIDHDTASMMVEDMGYVITSKILNEDELLSGESLSDAKAKKSGQPRAPVVTVMGHVDHGKTSLLDRIRNARVAEGEAGGITQRIAGYQVETSKGLVTFLDTPGHAAFTSMRARGANVTDIVVLVVAADDGVMPQTREAIRHAQAAGVPMIVAINKIDKPEANPDRVLQQLTEHNIIVEGYGGDVLTQNISAKTGEGVNDLLEQLALQSEMLELRAEREVPGIGSVVEGHIHKGRGPVATILVQEGTLRKGDTVVVGESVGKVRAMIVDGGRHVKEAGPATPVEILGLDAVPNPGEEVRVAKDLAAAKELAAHRREKRRAQELSGTAKVSLQDLFNRIGDDEQKELKLILKGDVQGSVEALGQSLTNLSTQKVKVSVISSGVGAVNESDVEFAAASEAIVVGFAVRPDTKALKAARALAVDIRTYDIIYEAVDEIQAAMRGLLAPVAKEQYIGRAEVLQTFNVPKVGTVAGCKVVDGIMQRNANIRLLRDSKVIYDGKLASLKRFKDDVREVKEGFECGMGMERFNDIKVGDIFEAYEIVMTEAALDEPIAPSSPSHEARP